MQIAKSRRTLRINSSAGPEGRKEDPREIGKSKCRATAAALARLIYLMGLSSLLNYFRKPLSFLSNLSDDTNVFGSEKILIIKIPQYSRIISN